MSYANNRHRSFYNKSKFSLVRNNSVKENEKNVRNSIAPYRTNNFRTRKLFNMSQNQNADQQESTPTVKQFGVTLAISLAEPCQRDLQRTEELLNFLQSQNVFESQEEYQRRITVLAKLNTLVKQWIKDVAISKNMPVMAIEKLGGKIYTFGSFRLGAHQKGADIDALCVAPRNIERADYFQSFFRLLKEQAEVTECRAIEKAFVPVIKMNFDGIEIDLLFARLSLKEIPDDLDLMDNSILKNLDPYSVRSLNGFRVTNQILAAVPNIGNFCLALLTIKLWAKKNGIYSNSLGYFGGVTWAMLVARTCQLYPNAAAATLVNKFFLVFSSWKWPNPVLLKHPDNFNLNFPVWDPRVNTSDRYHLMPIITPAYPQQNSTFNVSQSTKKIIMDEINRGLILTNEIMLSLVQWERLMEAPNFFYRYQHYLVLMVNSSSAEDHVNWCGFVESKVRFLITCLEQNSEITNIHANPKCYDYEGSNIIDTTTGNDNINAYSSIWFLALDTKNDGGSQDVDLSQDVDRFYDVFNQQKMKQGMSIEICYVEQKHIPQYLHATTLKSDQNINKNINPLKRLASDIIDSYPQPERPEGVKVRRLSN